MRPSFLIPVLLLSAGSAVIVGWSQSGGTPLPAVNRQQATKKTVPPPKTSAGKLAGPPSALAPASAFPSTEVPESGPLSILNSLATALKSADNNTDCRSIAQALAALGTEDAVDAIWLAAVAQKNPKLRAAILEGLDSVASPAMITFTASVLKATTDPEILDAAKQLVTRGADTETVSFLTELYTEAGTTESQQHHIEHTISTIRTEAAASALRALVQNLDTPRLAEAAAVSLFTLGTTRTMQQLIDGRAALAASDAPEAAQILESIDPLIEAAPESGNQPEMAQADGIAAP